MIIKYNPNKIQSYSLHLCEKEFEIVCTRKMVLKAISIVSYFEWLRGAI